MRDGLGSGFEGGEIAVDHDDDSRQRVVQFAKPFVSFDRREQSPLPGGFWGLEHDSIGRGLESGENAGDENADHPQRTCSG